MAGILDEAWAADTAVLCDRDVTVWAEQDDACHEVVPGWTMEDILQHAG